MTLLAASTARRRWTFPALPETSLIHSTSTPSLNWSQAQTLATVAQAPPASQLREQDDIVYDPADHDAPWKFYFTGSTANNDGIIWVTTSADRQTWAAPQQCTVAGSPMQGQDPSIVQALSTAPYARREGASLVMYYENDSTNDIDVASSADGIAWTVDQLSVVAKTGTGWEGVLVGSPVARHDGTRYILGYEGIAPTNEEQHGLAYGMSHTSLTKHPLNPVFGAPSLGLPGNSAFADSWWLTPDGSRIIIAGHAGSSQGTTMFRAYTNNTDPTTWETGDIISLGNIDAVRNDLTCDWWGDRLVSAPNNDLSLVALPLTQ